jgi:hypothetical protein
MGSAGLALIQPPILSNVEKIAYLLINEIK